MIKSLFKAAILTVAFSITSYSAFSQYVSGPAQVSCGSFSLYTISVPGQLQSCQGVWYVTYPNGSVTSYSGTSLYVNWGSNPGYASVAFQGSCTYIPSSSGPGSNGGIQVIGGSNNQSATMNVNHALTVLVGSGTMPKPSISGPGHFCTDETKTFSISSVPNAVSYTYTAPTGWSINGGGNVLTTSALSVNVTSPSSATSSYALMKVRTNGPNCTAPSEDAAKGFRFGTVIPSIVGNTEVTPNSYNEYFGTATEGLVGGTWTKPSSWTLISDYGLASQVYQMPSTTSAGVIILSGTSCGNYVQATKSVLVSNVSFGGFKSNESDNAISPEEQIEVHPNPANNELNISVEGTELDKITLVNMTGQVLLSAQSKDQLDVSLIPSGVYLLQMNTVDGRSITRRVQIQH